MNLDLRPKIVTTDLAAGDGLLISSTPAQGITYGLGAVVASDVTGQVHRLSLAPVMQRLQFVVADGGAADLYVNALGRGACLLASYRASGSALNVDMLVDLSADQVQYLLVATTRGFCSVFTQSDLFNIPAGSIASLLDQLGLRVLAGG